MTSNRIQSLVLVALLAACSSQGGAQTMTEPTEPRRDEAPHAEQNARAPVTVAVSGPAAIDGGEIELSIVIHRSFANDWPLHLAVALPEGVTLVAGSLDETIVEPQALAIERKLRLAVASVPPQDVVVRVSARGANYGVHAEDAYRFGRPAPKLATPPRGPALSPHGRRLGEPIPLTR
jgi:hypothetical protein